MIGFRDFAPRELSAPKHGDRGSFETLDTALRAANDWIEAERVEVVNVETVVLPSYSTRLKGETSDPSSYVCLSNYWFASRQFIRVWYRRPRQETS